jgi:hypothetical protein
MDRLLEEYDGRRGRGCLAASRPVCDDRGDLVIEIGIPLSCKQVPPSPFGLVHVGWPGALGAEPHNRVYQRRVPGQRSSGTAWISRRKTGRSSCQFSHLHPTAIILSSTGENREVVRNPAYRVPGQHLSIIHPWKYDSAEYQRID